MLAVSDNVLNRGPAGDRSSAGGLPEGWRLIMGSPNGQIRLLRLPDHAGLFNTRLA